MLSNSIMKTFVYVRSMSTFPPGSTDGEFLASHGALEKEAAVGVFGAYSRVYLERVGV